MSSKFAWAAVTALSIAVIAGCKSQQDYRDIERGGPDREGPPAGGGGGAGAMIDSTQHSIVYINYSFDPTS